MLYLSQISASGWIGSKAPRTVVPDVQHTKNGLFPLSKSDRIHFSSSSGIIRPL